MFDQPHHEGGHVPSTPDAAVRVAKATSLLKERGWAKGYWDLTDGSICPGLALLVAFEKRPARSKMCEELKLLPVTTVILAAAEVKTGKQFDNIPNFNDDHSTTLEVVLEVLGIACRWILAGSCGTDIADAVAKADVDRRIDLLRYTPAHATALAA